ncbi:hypothetical protein EJB05_43954, partial [Eragrostis curvula]
MAMCDRLGVCYDFGKVLSVTMPSVNRNNLDEMRPIGKAVVISVCSTDALAPNTGRVAQKDSRNRDMLDEMRSIGKAAMMAGSSDASGPSTEVVARMGDRLLELRPPPNLIILEDPKEVDGISKREECQRNGRRRRILSEEQKQAKRLKERDQYAAMTSEQRTTRRRRQALLRRENCRSHGSKRTSEYKSTSYSGPVVDIIKS